MVYRDPLTLVNVVDFPADADQRHDNITDGPTPQNGNVIRLVFGAGNMRNYVDVARYEISRMSEMLEQSLQGGWYEKSTQTCYINSELPCATTFLMFLECMGSYNHSYKTPLTLPDEESKIYGPSDVHRRVCLAAAVAAMADYLLCPEASYIIAACYRKICDSLKNQSDTLDCSTMERVLSLTGADAMEKIWVRVVTDCVPEFCKWYFWSPQRGHGPVRPQFKYEALYNKSLVFKAKLHELSLACVKDGVENAGSTMSAKYPGSFSQFQF